MRYLSTRGSCPPVGFDGALIGGLAPDGGLYVPEEWPAIDVHPSVERYTDVAVDVLAPYVSPAIPRDELRPLVEEAYATFSHADVCPVTPLEDGLHLLELFWGPTLAFKDVALQLLGRLMDRELARRDERATVLVATSGDTGSAAIEACRGRDRLDIVVLHPAGRVSDVQRRQMTTVDEPNVRNVAIDGDFDTCQDLVKAAFADTALRDELRLSAMNSINWARVMAQVVYYVTAAAAVAPDGPVSFAVPTGNFGNVLAGWVAKQGGLDVDRLIVGSNRNDILTRWIASGVMEVEGVEPSLSPSMDIQVSSNVERYLWELYGRNGAVVAEAMARFRSDGRLDIGAARLDRVRATFSGVRVDDEATLFEIQRVHEAHGVLVDPHTAIGIAAARAVPSDPDVPRVVLATAHPAKFPDAVEAATGVRPLLPEHLADLLDRPEHLTPLAADSAVLADYLRAELL
ncbi:threonine synthase [Iamia sp. SCSIO 61187]|uniref:threonine synthase n=1 Tax=Iamia sp. SCSIO 61187 TaxID=2722752 RepID=UPI001C63621C|nr:threonine synthase [Iamia sp. SCSIO 61187]QYG91615.1 threonine synthase [Iamia sp. SCSIO 61187]